MPCSVTPGVWSYAVFALTLLLSPCALAQHGGGGATHAVSGQGGQGGPGGMGQGAPGMPGNFGYGPRDYNHPNGGPPGGPDGQGPLHGGLQLGPPGRWWDDKHLAKDLKLRPDQQRHMDSIFESNRPVLLNRLSTVQQEELRLMALSHSRAPEEGTMDAQIDRVWQARAELEKAKTHYLLQIRQEMDADQISRLEEHRVAAIGQ